MGVHLSLLVMLAFQGTPQDASGFRPAAPPDLPKAAQPAKPLSPEMRGDIFMARKMYREAAEMYKQEPESAIIANKIGISYHQMQDLNMARKYYERAIKLDPAYSEAVNNLGTVYYAQKSYRRAITQYKKALRLKPDSASMISNLGTAYFARKNYDLAQEMYQKALELDPEVFERRSTQGTLLQERSVEERARMHYTLAKAYAKTGKTDLAILYIRKALEEGFKEREKFQKEPEFAVLQDNDEFKKLMAAEPRVL
jgi:tetratricopeptide (TPR) repeat protein